MRAKYTAKWGVQMVGMNFQTHSKNGPDGYGVKTVIRMEKRRQIGRAHV